MRFHNVLQGVMESKSQAAILTALLRYPGKIFSGREIARLTGVSKSRTAEILSGLESSNIINKQTVGAANGWSVNQESALVEYLSKNLLQLDGYIFNSLKNDVKKCFSDIEEISKVILYGSVARGDETNYSDIDLLVLLKNNVKKSVLEKVDKLNLLTISKYGNPISAIIYTEREFAKSGLAAELKDRISEEGITLIER